MEYSKKEQKLRNSSIKSIISRLIQEDGWGMDFERPIDVTYDGVSSIDDSEYTETIECYGVTYNRNTNRFILISDSLFDIPLESLWTTSLIAIREKLSKM
jgi:hypothetical protein